jgi:phenylpropionate dioxygenase-like ring-hydroxylating dioxygenase large terminal subunit
MSLAGYWHPVAEMREVSEQPARFTLLGEPLVLFRHEEGVAAFSDLCIHRGTALSLGWITNGRLTCAYHGWQYDHSGACVHIPSLPEGASIPSKARAFAYRVQERYGLVWVALAEPLASIPSWPDDAYDDPVYRCHLVDHAVWQTSAGRAIENFIDFSHFPFVHPHLLADPDQTLVEPHEIVATEEGYMFTIELPQPVTAQNPRGELVRYDYFVSGPFTCHIKKITADGEITYVSLFASPTAMRETHLFVLLGRNYGHDVPDENFDEFTLRLFAQDRVIVESQRPEQIPTDLREELHLKVPDASGMAYRRLLGKIEQATAYGP